MKKIFIAGVLYALPFVALAQNLTEATKTIGKVVNIVIPIVGAILLVFFFVGAIQYVSAKGDEEARTEARNRMIYAVIGMFVAFSVFGLVGLLRNTFGVGPESELTLPGGRGFFQF